MVQRIANKRKNKSKKPVKSRVPRTTALTAYQHSLVDPCNGPLVSPYGGDAGYITRFDFDATINTAAGATAGVFVLFPGNETIWSFSASTSGTATPIVSSNGPGQAFLGTNASQVRAVAACMTVIPSAVSTNNITGEIGVAVIPSNTFQLASSYTADNAMQLCNQRSVLAKRTYEAKWFPSPGDALYSNQVVGAAATNTSPVNGIMLVYKGYPAATALSIRLTVVMEWTPVSSLGIPSTSTPRPPQNHEAQAAALHQAHPNWWNNLTETVSSAFNGLVGGVASDLASAGRYTARGLITAGVSKIARTALPLLMM